MRALSLFSGVGLHDLGLQRAGWQIIGQVEKDPWCRAVLEKHWPGLWRMEDIRNVTAAALSGLGKIDLVTGGFPCPDISSAGRGVGLLRGGRSSLWLEMLRIIRDCRPTWVLAENVPALRTRGIDTVLSGLEEADYAAWSVVVGAWAVGAPHRRDRAWIIGRRVADVARGRQRGEPEAERSNGERAREGGNGGVGNAACHNERRNGQGQGRQQGETGGSSPRMAHANSGALRLESGRSGGANGSGTPEPGGSGEGMANANGSRSGDGLRLPAGGSEDLPDPDGRDGRIARWPARRGEPQYEWEPPRLTESGLGRGADGRASRLDGFRRRNRLKALGNANPPHVPEMIGRWMLSQVIGFHAKGER